MAKIETLRNSLKAVSAQIEAPRAEGEVSASDSSKPQWRVGKVHLGGWHSPSYKQSLRTIQLKHPEKTLQDLYGEALNDLFAKYNVPVIHE